MGGMVPMTWDINSRSQNGTKGTMTIVDRKNLTVYGKYALEGINEIYPRPSEDGVSSVTIKKADDNALYNLQGMRVNESQMTKGGIFIKGGRKIIVE